MPALTLNSHWCINKNWLLNLEDVTLALQQRAARWREVCGGSGEKIMKKISSLPRVRILGFSCAAFMFVHGSQHNQEIHIASLKANERVSDANTWIGNESIVLRIIGRLTDFYLRPDIKMACTLFDQRSACKRFSSRGTTPPPTLRC